MRIFLSSRKRLTLLSFRRMLLVDRKKKGQWAWWFGWASDVRKFCWVFEWALQKIYTIPKTSYQIKRQLYKFLPSIRSCLRPRSDEVVLLFSSIITGSDTKYEFQITTLICDGHERGCCIKFLLKFLPITFLLKHVFLAYCIQIF